MSTSNINQVYQNALTRQSNSLNTINVATAGGPQWNYQPNTSLNSPLINNNTVTVSGHPGMVTVPNMTTAPRPLSRKHQLLQKMDKRVQNLFPEFKKLDFEVALEFLGNERPTYSERPKKFIFPMLLAGRPVRFFNQNLYINAGLALALPYVTGKAKAKVILTLTGLALLEHWAAKNDTFKKFFDAYIGKKERELIASYNAPYMLGERSQKVINMEIENQTNAANQRLFLDNFIKLVGAMPLFRQKHPEKKTFEVSGLRQHGNKKMMAAQIMSMLKAPEFKRILPPKARPQVLSRLAANHIERFGVGYYAPQVFNYNAADMCWMVDGLVICYD